MAAREFPLTAGRAEEGRAKVCRAVDGERRFVRPAVRPERPKRDIERVEKGGRGIVVVVGGVEWRVWDGIADSLLVRVWVDKSLQRLYSFMYDTSILGVNGTMGMNRYGTVK